MSANLKTFELLRDLLRVIEGYVDAVTEIEVQQSIDVSNLANILKGDAILSMFTLSVQFDPQKQSAFARAFGNIVSILPQMQNPLALKTSEKKEFVRKLDTICRDLELIVGVGKATSKATDLDAQLLEQCRNKNYHDTVSNAFPLLEDKIRQKLNVNRNHHGSELIDLAFNPKTGKLVLGETEAEKEGTYFLFKGALMFIRNPPAHTQSGEEDRNSALKVLYMVDFLMKMVDKAESRTTS